MSAAYKSRLSTNPLFSVELAGAQNTITVSGLTCDSRDYLIVAKLTASVDGSTVTAATNIEAATVYNGANVESLVGSSLDFDTIAGTMGPVYGYTTGTIRVRAKSGNIRHLLNDWNGIIAGRYFRIWGGAYFPTTTGQVTSITLTISAGNFTAGSSLTVYDAGVAT